MSIKSLVYFVSEMVKNFLYPVQHFSGDISKAPSIYECKFIDDKGEQIDLSMYKGKKLLIVNSASECGYTKQYSSLEVLHKEYPNELNIVAFPCNDFGHQEKGSNSEIQNFCTKNFGVTFKVMPKTNVKLSTPGQLFYWLTRKDQNGWNNSVPLWNFWKFLLSEDGKLIAVFSSKRDPLGSEMLDAIKQ